MVALFNSVGDNVESCGITIFRVRSRVQKTVNTPPVVPRALGKKPLAHDFEV